MRSVLDSNVIVSSFVFGGRLLPIRQAWAAGRLVPILCQQTADELLRVLGYAKFNLTTDEQAAVAALLRLAEMHQSPTIDRQILAMCRDRTDAIFIALAQEAAVPLVSGDKDITALKAIAPVEVLSPAELIARLPA